jgi:translation elongation factor EF-G
MEPLTPLETLCRIILRAREYEAQVPTDYDGGEAPENVDNEGEETLSVLDDSLNTSVEEELIASIEDLAEDQQVELLAFALVGQGTYEVADWDEAIEAAAEENNIVEELMDMPMLASVLEAGMAAFDINCDGIGDLS